MVNYMKITKIDYLFFGIAGILFIVVMGSLALNLTGYITCMQLDSITRYTTPIGMILFIIYYLIEKFQK